MRCSVGGMPLADPPRGPHGLPGGGVAGSCYGLGGRDGRLQHGGAGGIRVVLSLLSEVNCIEVEHVRWSRPFNKLCYCLHLAVPVSL